MPHYDSDAFAAILLHDPLISDATRDEASSSYTQRGAVPGVAVYQRESIGYSSATAGTLGPQLKLHAVGSQSSDIQARVSRAGMPGDGLEIVTRVADVAAESGTSWRAGTTPQVLEDIAAAVLNRGLDGVRNFDGVDLGDGNALVVWNNQAIIYGRIYDRSTKDWSAAAVTIADHTRAMDADGAQPGGAGYVDDSPVAVMRLPTGRLMVAAMVLGPGSGADLVTHYSDDNGLTWRSGTLQGYDIELPQGASYDSIDWAYSAESVLLLIGEEYQDGDDTLRGWVQYASSDLGASFRLVQDWNDGASTYAVDRPSIAVDLVGTFHVFYTRTSLGGGTRYVQVRSIASPWVPLRGVDAIDIRSAVSSSLTARDVTAWAETTGSLWVAWGSDSSQVRAARSDSYGLSWAVLSTPLLSTAPTDLDRLLAIPVGGGVLWLVGASTGLTRPAQWLTLCESGGWTMLPQPRVAAGHPFELRGWADSWPAVALPTVMGWTLASGTAATVAASGTVQATMAAAGIYSKALANTPPSTGLIAQFELSTQTSSAVTKIGIELDVGDGTDDIRVGAYVENAQVTIYDLNAAGNVGVFSYTATARTVYRLAARYSGSGNTVSLYGRSHTSAHWDLLVAGSVTRRVGTGGNAAIRFGHLGTGGASTWHHVAVATADGVGSHTATTDALAAGLALSKAPDSLPGAPLPAAPGKIWIEGSLFLRGRSGPGLRGDLWAVDRSYRYPVTNLLTRSPQEKAHSTGGGSDYLVVWSPRGGDPHHPGGTVLGLGVVSANVRYHKLQGDSGSGLVDLITLDLASGTTGLSYTRDGDTLRVAAGSSAGYLRPVDLIGGTVDFGGGVRRSISGATAGVWVNGSIGVTLQIDLTGGEPSSGTINIWRTQGAALRLGDVTSYQKLAYLIPTQGTVAGRFQVGRVIIGRPAIFATMPSRGRSTQYDVQTSIQETPGAIGVRKLGPMRRTFALGWVEGVPQVWGQTQSYLTLGGIPGAMRGDVSAVETITQAIGGQRGEGFYLPRVEYDADAVAVETVQAIGREAAVYVSPDGSPTVEDVQGRLGKDPVQRVAGLSLLEVV